MWERAAFHSLDLDYHQYLQSGASGADLHYGYHFQKPRKKGVGHTPYAPPRN